MIWYVKERYGWTLGSNIPKELADGPATSPTLQKCSPWFLTVQLLSHSTLQCRIMWHTSAMGCVSRWLAMVSHTLYGQALYAIHCIMGKQASVCHTLYGQASASRWLWKIQTMASEGLQATPPPPYGAKAKRKPAVYEWAGNPYRHQFLVRLPTLFLCLSFNSAFHEWFFFLFLLELWLVKLANSP